MSASRPSLPVDLEITIVSAKHLKNVNWRHGELKPYAVVYLDSDRRAATKSDDCGSTRPVWNERLLIPLPPLPIDDPSLILTVDVFHSKPCETSKPLVGSVRFLLKDLIADLSPAAEVVSSPIRTLQLRRPSGRPQGKIRVRLAVKEGPAPPPEPSYHVSSPYGYYYSTVPPPVQSARDYSGFSPPPPPLPPCSHPARPEPSQYSYGSYSDPYSGYYASGTGYYSASPAPLSGQPPARSYYDRGSGYGGPSAPVDYSAGSSYYEQKPKGNRLGVGAGLAVGAVAGAMGPVALEEGVKYKERIAERVESDLAARDAYSDYIGDY